MTATESRTAAVLIVSSSYSTCGHCHEQTLPDCAVHEKVSGYGGGAPGCGARFTAITSDTSHVSDYWRGLLLRMRPDLPVIEHGEPAPPVADHKIGPIRRIHRSKHLDYCSLGRECGRRHDFRATCSCGWHDTRGRRMYVEREAATHMGQQPSDQAS